MSDEWQEAEVLLADIVGKKDNRVEKNNSSTSKISKEVARILMNMNFEVISISPNSISIRGRFSDFQNYFELKRSKTNNMDNTMKVPKILEDYVEGIYLQNPPSYF